MPDYTDHHYSDENFFGVPQHLSHGGAGSIAREEPMIRGVKFVSIPTRDQDRALAFWTEKVGMRVLTDQPMGPQRWIELSFPGADTGLVLFTPEGHEDRIGGFMNTSLWCDDLARTHAELTSNGVQFERPPTKEKWGTYAIFLDSEGNRFVLGEGR
jgi:predicted enzyme related to lactoylglutathione lyase